jgi:DNA-binding transcriptional LysR family regulator
MMQNPGIELHLESTNRRVDVIAEGLDLAVRVRFPPLEPTDLVMRRFDDSTQCLVAAPGVADASTHSPADLHNLASMDLGPPRPDHAWQLHHADGQVATVPHTPRLVTDDMSALRHAAIAGVGAVQLPTIFIWDDIREGRLVHVLPAWRPRAGIVHAVFPSRRGLLPSVRASVDFLARECAAQRAEANRFVPPVASLPQA